MWGKRLCEDMKSGGKRCVWQRDVRCEVVRVEAYVWCKVKVRVRKCEGLGIGGMDQREVRGRMHG